MKKQHLIQPHRETSVERRERAEHYADDQPLPNGTGISGFFEDEYHHDRLIHGPDQPTQPVITPNNITVFKP